MTELRHYCTYFDERYLPRALVLIDSLAHHSAGGFHMWALCLTDAAYDALVWLGVPDVTPVRLRELEEADPELLSVRPTRSAVEYYFTCSPVLPLFILEEHPVVTMVTYLDADMRFYSSPEPLFAELGEGSVAIVGHRYPDSLAHLEAYGVYNVAWCSFRNDSSGIAMLRQWRADCIEWCYDRVEPSRFADQKYLDAWPGQPGVVVLTHAGADLAPWNLQRHTATFLDVPRSDGQPLIFYHFHGLKRDGHYCYDLNLHPYGVTPARSLITGLYRPYLRELARAGRRVAGVLPPSGTTHSTLRHAGASPSRLRERFARLRPLVHVVRRRSVVAR